VYEKDELVHVEMEVPGYTTENLDISITGDILKVTGKSSEGSEHKQGRRYYVSEISEKSFTRTITLPYEVIAEEAKAEFRNGMLTLVLPKSEKAKPKTIKISAE
jgi:HSP20 family protein